MRDNRTTLYLYQLGVLERFRDQRLDAEDEGQQVVVADVARRDEK